VEKKLKVLQALKRSQEVVAKYSGQCNHSTSSFIPEIDCAASSKQIVVGKLKKKIND
jgi:hypothetical protein